MNWLAHLHLASIVGLDPAGSLLPDIVNPTNLPSFTPRQQQAIKLHQSIDRFTDSHPVVLRSKTYISPPYTRLSGILVDIFYDHCLCQCWEEYTEQPITTFIQETHTAFHTHLPTVPTTGQVILQRMMTEEWLLSYQTLDGIQLSLERISQRMNGRINLIPALDFLAQHNAHFMNDFRNFYPMLLEYVKKSAT